MKNTLYLLPNLLHVDQDPKEAFVPAIESILSSVKGLFAESEKEGQKFLKKFSKSLPIELINEHTEKKEIEKELLPKLKKESWALISDCGLACIADPGTYLVHLARESNIQVKTFPGSCSITMALQVSGLSGQCFCFMGYLPRKTDELKKQLKILEKRSFHEDMTIIFIETPYRTKKIIEVCSETLRDKTRLCVAKNLGSKEEKVICLPISAWKKKEIVKEKVPTIFLFQS